MIAALGYVFSRNTLSSLLRGACTKKHKGQFWGSVVLSVVKLTRNGAETSYASKSTPGKKQATNKYILF